MKYIKTFESFINQANKVNEARVKTNRDISKLFGKSVSDIDQDEDGGSFILQGDLEEIKDIVKKNKLNSEEVEHWGIRIWEESLDVESEISEDVINEGQFSWMTSDTNKQIGSEKENTITVYMFDNEGNSWKEKKYDGYGEFGGKDYYELVATMNGYDADRQIGIDLAFDKIKTKDKKKKTLFPALVENPKFNWKRHDFTEEPDNDPNQSWHTEDEDEDEYGW
tara:strand:+ start:1011 stop:1679 length:669 start_codon:yes stop_codon:yes gene_type:complete